MADQQDSSSPNPTRLSPERPFYLTLTVAIESFGKPEHEDKLAYQLAKTLANKFGLDKAIVFREGKIIEYDPIKDDGHEVLQEEIDRYTKETRLNIEELLSKHTRSVHKEL